MVNDVVLVDALRTPVGRAGPKGWLKSLRPEDMLVPVLDELLRRQPNIAPADLDDVVIGCGNQGNVQNRNVSRKAVLMSKSIPVSVPAQTINRACGSSLEAFNNAVRAIAGGFNDVVIAGGVETMSMNSVIEHSDEHPALRDLYESDVLSMGTTAENVAERFGVSRRAQDEWAVTSHQRAKSAQDRNAFDEEILPLLVDGASVSVDQCVRPDTTVERLAELRALFREGGSVTAGNSCPINDGASAVILTSRAYAQEHGLQPLARVRAMATCGVEPEIMGIGPVPATLSVLEKLGLSVGDIDLFELNEAFAAQVVAVVESLSLPAERTNVNGGAIALGHAVGSTGTRLITTLAYELRRRGGGTGVATLCVGLGQGMATVIESE